MWCLCYKSKQSMDLNECWEFVLGQVNDVVEDQYPIVIDQFSS